MAVAEAKQETRNVVELPVMPKRRERRRLIRLGLLTLGPLVALGVAAEMYLSGGRYVETDNAYVRAPIMNVATDVAGTVADVAVHENQHVDKGELLFTLDAEPFRISLAGAKAQLGMVRNDLIALQATYRQNLSAIDQAKSSLDYAQATYDRQLNLQKRGVAAQASLDEARRDLATAQEQLRGAQRAADATLSQLGGNAEGSIEGHPRMLEAQAVVDRAQRDLTRATILAPWSGTVANVENLRIGAYVIAGQPAMSLVASDDLWVEANPKETDLGHLKVGDTAEVSVDAYPGIAWKAKVTGLSPATGAEFSVLPPQNASGNWVKVVQRVPVKLALEKKPNAPMLTSGMSVDVSIGACGRSSARAQRRLNRRAPWTRRYLIAASLRSA
ncbi:MAG: HlyD family secretion protein [Alphaproteobacteria bacterium]|nr:MAG: HlyD family secretion protein [Alphaproteobacteria bacterium]